MPSMKHAGETGSGMGQGADSGYTFHGSTWNPNTIAHANSEDFDTSSFKYGPASDTVFIINEVVGNADTDQWSNISFWIQSQNFHTQNPVLIRRDDNTCSIQLVWRNHLQWGPTMYGSNWPWYTLLCFGVALGNIGVPYGEVGG